MVSGVDACVSDTRASGGDCVGRFSKVLKCSCHLAATDALSDSSFPSSAFNRAEVAHFCNTVGQKKFHLFIFAITLSNCIIFFRIFGTQILK